MPKRYFYREKTHAIVIGISQVIPFLLDWQYLSTKAFPEFKASLSPGEIAPYIAQFALTGQQFYNGKVLPISSSTP